MKTLKRLKELFQRENSLLKGLINKRSISRKELSALLELQQEKKKFLDELFLLHGKQLVENVKELTELRSLTDENRKLTEKLLKIHGNTISS